MPEVVKIEREDIRHLLVHVGFRLATGWDDTKLLKNINDFNSIADVETPLEDERAVKIRATIVEALAAGATFELAGDATPVVAAPKEPKAKKEKTPKEPKAPKEPKPVKEPKAKKEKPVKVAKVTAPHLVGQLIAKSGIAAGVVESMVTEFGLRYGRPNPYRTWFDFKQGWHAIRGYEGSQLESAPGVTVSNTRPFLAGKILKEKGLEVEINDVLVAELDTRYGKANADESMAILRIAKGAIQGFQAGAPTGDIPEAPAPEAPAEGTTEAEAPEAETAAAK